jgi:hypothetical protein
MDHLGLHGLTTTAGGSAPVDVSKTSHRPIAALKTARLFPAVVMFDHSATKLLASALFTKVATCLIGEFIHFAFSKDFINEVDRGVDAYHSKKYRNVRH